MNLPFDPVWLLAAIPFTLLLFFLTAKRGGGRAGYPYVAAPILFTANERLFLTALGEAAGAYRIFGKVRVADLIEVRKGLSKGERQRAFNRISQKHLDFVLCHPNDLSVFCAVELDDRSHERARRRARDAFLEGTLAAAGLPLVGVPSSRSYDIDELRALLSRRPKSGLGPGDNAEPVRADERPDTVSLF
jgi:hypothetical protein